MNPMPAPSLAYKPPCPGKTPVRAPSAYEEWGTNPNECSGNWPTKVYIEDTIKIPTDIPVRTYVFNVCLFFNQRPRVNQQGCIVALSVFALPIESFLTALACFFMTGG